MTKIKLCGLSCPCDIEKANELLPEFVGFIFAKKSRRFIPPPKAAELKNRLDARITAVGVFVDEEPEAIARLLNDEIIGMAQLHGHETEDYIARLRQLTAHPIMQAFRIEKSGDVDFAIQSSADFILLDSGGGTGTAFDWKFLHSLSRPYFLAGGLDAENVKTALEALKPYAVDVSSGIETEGQKDTAKMAAFVAAVRKEG